MPVPPAPACCHSARALPSASKATSTPLAVPVPASIGISGCHIASRVLNMIVTGSSIRSPSLPSTSVVIVSVYSVSGSSTASGVSATWAPVTSNVTSTGPASLASVIASATTVPASMPAENVSSGSTVRDTSWSPSAGAAPVTANGPVHSISTSVTSAPSMVPVLFARVHTLTGAPGWLATVTSYASPSPSSSEKEKVPGASIVSSSAPLLLMTSPLPVSPVTEPPTENVSSTPPPEPPGSGSAGSPGFAGGSSPPPPHAARTSDKNAPRTGKRLLRATVSLLHEIRHVAYRNRR